MVRSATVSNLTPDGSVDFAPSPGRVHCGGTSRDGVFVPYRRPFGAALVSPRSTPTARSHKLASLATFPRAYTQALYSFAIGSMSGGDLWMQNESGAILHLNAKRTGPIASL
jgi:hypothetical protein